MGHAVSLLIVREVLKLLAQKVARSQWASLVAALLLLGGGLAAEVDRWWIVAPLIGIGIALQVLIVYGTRALRDEVVEYKVLLDATMQPLVHALQLLASHRAKKDKDAQLMGVLTAVMVGARQLSRAGTNARVRASLFCLDEACQTPTLVPHPAFSMGRGDRPVSRFVRGEGEGKSVWEAAEKDELTFFADLAKEHPPGMDLSRKRSYRTFMTAPIRVDGRVVGLLTVNGPTPGDLDDSDALVMRILATHAGVALQICGGEWPSSGRQ